MCSLLPANGQDKNAVTLAKTIPLPAVPGGFNHMSVDAEHQRLFVTATTKQTVEIIDLKAGKPWCSLPCSGVRIDYFSCDWAESPLRTSSFYAKTYRV